MMDLENEQQSAADNAEILDETEVKTSEGEASAPETVETDEEKNKRVQAEASEKARLKEEKKQQSINQRFAEITADKYAAIERANLLAEQNAKILALLEGKQNGTATQPQGEPTREQFESYEDFITARAEFRAEQKAQKLLDSFSQKQTETQQKTAQEQEAQTVEKQFLERKAAAEKSIPDFKETVADWEPKLPNSVVDMIIRMPDGPMIAYHMAKNPELEAQFNSQPAYMQGIILGQISASLKTPPKVSSAPAPGKPVASKPGSSTEPPSDPNQYYAWAKKHLK